MNQVDTQTNKLLRTNFLILDQYMQNVNKKKLLKFGSQINVDIDNDTDLDDIINGIVECGMINQEPIQNVIQNIYSSSQTNVQPSITQVVTDISNGVQQLNLSGAGEKPNSNLDITALKKVKDLTETSTATQTRSAISSVFKISNFIAMSVGYAYLGSKLEDAQLLNYLKDTLNSNVSELSKVLLVENVAETGLFNDANFDTKNVIVSLKNVFTQKIVINGFDLNKIDYNTFQNLLMSSLKHSQDLMSNKIYQTITQLFESARKDEHFQALTSASTSLAELVQHAFLFLQNFFKQNISNVDPYIAKISSALIEFVKLVRPSLQNFVESTGTAVSDKDYQTLLLYFCITVVVFYVIYAFILVTTETINDFQSFLRSIQYNDRDYTEEQSYIEPLTTQYAASAYEAVEEGEEQKPKNIDYDAEIQKLMKGIEKVNEQIYDLENPQDSTMSSSDVEEVEILKLQKLNLFEQIMNIDATYGQLSYRKLHPFSSRSKIQPVINGVTDEMTDIIKKIKSKAKSNQDTSDLDTLYSRYNKFKKYLNAKKDELPQNSYGKPKRLRKNKKYNHKKNMRSLK